MIINLIWTKGLVPWLGHWPHPSDNSLESFTPTVSGRQSPIQNPTNRGHLCGISFFHPLSRSIIACPLSFMRSKWCNLAAGLSAGEREGGRLDANAWVDIPPAKSLHNHTGPCLQRGFIHNQTQSLIGMYNSLQLTLGFLSLCEFLAAKTALNNLPILSESFLLNQYSATCTWLKPQCDGKLCILGAGSWVVYWVLRWKGDWKAAICHFIGDGLLVLQRKKEGQVVALVQKQLLLIFPPLIPLFSSAQERESFLVPMPTQVVYMGAYKWFLDDKNYILG